MDRKRAGMFSAVIAGAMLSASTGAFAGPIMLNNDQLDQVTAGIVLSLLTGAQAVGGNFVLTETNGGGATTQTNTPGGGYVQSGLILGTAAAVAPGGTPSASVTTGGSVPGQIYGTTVGTTVTTPIAQTSVGLTFVTGGTSFVP